MTPGRHERPRWGAWKGSLGLARLHLRTHRFSVVGWPAVIVALSASTAAGISSLYATAGARQGYAATIGASTMSIAFNGRGYDLDTLGGITVNELGVYALLVYPAIAVHLAVRHTRGEEEAGREELLTAARVGRLAPLAAGGLVTGLVLVAAGLLSGVSMAATGLPARGSMHYAGALTLAMLAYAGVGLVAAQLSQSTRVANALAVGVLGAAYLARAAVDGRGGSLVWPNPTGWLAEASPFGAARIWPLLGYGALTLALVGAATVLRARRDLGAGVFAERPGAPSAAARLDSPWDLTWRLSRASLVGWGAGAALWGGVMGMLGPEMRTMLAANPTLAAYLGPSGADPVDLLVWLSIVLTALLAGALAVSGVTRLAAEELSARAGLVLSTRVGRLRWLGAAAGVTAVQSVLVLLAGGAAVGTSLAISLGDTSAPRTAVGAALGFVPAVLLIELLAVAAWALEPRLAHVGWVVLGWASVVAFLGDTLRLPQWARGLSPLQHVGRVPIEDLALVGVLVTAVVAICVGGLAAARFRARDLRAG